MVKKNTPPWYGLSGGPIIVACQWNRSSPTGPALHCAGGSLPRSCSSLLILFNAICTAAVLLCEVTSALYLGVLDPGWKPTTKIPAFLQQNLEYSSLGLLARYFLYFTLVVVDYRRKKSVCFSSLLCAVGFFFPYWLLCVAISSRIHTQARTISHKGGAEWKKNRNRRKLKREKRNVSVYGDSVLLLEKK